VSVCGKPTNRSGGVDVHAVKHYDSSACNGSGSKQGGQEQGESQEEQTTTTPTTPTTTTTATTTTTQSSLPTVPAATVTVQSATSGTGSAPGATVSPQVVAASGGSTPAVAPSGAGGVLGAQANLASGKPHAGGGHGVLGATARIAGATLPFTGLPLWVPVLIAAALLAAGLLVRRHARAGVRP
jgi:hypothetical protein